MKKVGILTLPLKDNYGGILQATALYTHISNMGCEAIFINKSTFHPIWKRSLIATLERVPFQNLKGFRSAYLNNKEHRPFISSIITNTTAELKTPTDLENLESQYGFDSVVVGSDQVWRLDYIDKRHYGSYFLNFLDGRRTRKIAYAASFGLETWPRPENRVEIAKLLSEFHAVSTREDSGVVLCREFGRLDCFHALDPTLLVDKSFYDKITAIVPKTQNRNILTYILDDNVAKEKIVRECMSSFGRQYSRENILQSQRSIQHYSIPCWIGAFRDAEFVITDSFHGMLLAIIFNKQFIALCNTSRGASRFESMLRALHLSSRMIFPDCAPEVRSLLEVEIDYSRVNNELDRWRAASRKFLEQAILSD